MTDVVIAGAGPTGLTLAIELARRGVDVRIVDRAAEHFPGSRGKGLTARTQEVLDDLGVADEALQHGFRHLPHRRYVDGDLVAEDDPHAQRSPTPDRPYDGGLLIPQWRIERILRARLAEEGVRVELAAGVAEFSQSADSVHAVLDTGEQVAARYLVGCDGGRSTVRKALDVRFEGESRAQAMLLGDVELDGLEPDAWYQWTVRGRGFLALCPFRDERSWQLQAVPLRDFGAEGGVPEPSLPYFRRIVDDLAGGHGIHLSKATWLSTYRVNVRMVDRFKVGRVLLAGDAAHVHPPAGGLGMNTGIQDAYNLGWKLAMVCSGAPQSMLDSYEEERLPVAAWTLGASTEGLRRVAERFVDGGSADITDGAHRDGQQLRLGYPSSSLSVDGDAGNGPRAGDRAPDAPCVDRSGTPRRLFDAFRGPHFTLLGFGDSCAGALADAAHSRLIEPVSIGAPGSGADLVDVDGHARTAYGVTGDTLVLVRPDGYLALRAPGASTTAVPDYLNRVGVSQIA
ncbi:FAD-dependent oxidoreductase [Actinocatenispora comari]|uniref:3-(3-hydroxyphenyl)propionate hydroxylase n=1 Tax=Actinocatenispora comari TaxID=2807577 RepID=A0A8J4AIG5_9ACTN|nr:FAD-dependent oxidoreductase [Actinocatenispora comari]GIL31829.1 3-(3-hydroxyphenyl)propionate hydroxylase [Actinocatenispora comari]